MAKSIELRAKANNYFRITIENCLNDSLRGELIGMAFKFRKEQKELEYEEYRKRKQQA